MPLQKLEISYNAEQPSQVGRWVPSYVGLGIVRLIKTYASTGGLAV
jgi:hypothetical protein